MKRSLGAWSICTRPLSGICGRALLALAAILVAGAGCLSPVFATTTVSSNFIQNLSLDADPQHLNSHAVSKIAVSGPYVHVVWLGYNVADWSGSSLYYRRSTDGGKTFEAPILLVPKDKSLEFDQKFNNLVADGADLHIFYTDGWPRKLNYIRSDDNGGTFAPVVTLVSGYYEYAVYATAENGDVAVGYTLNGTNDPTGHPKALYGARSSDGGATFSTTTVALNDDSHNPGIWSHSIVDAVRTGNYVYFLTIIQNENWFSTQSHLYLWASTDGGATFKPPQKVNVKAANDGYYATTIQNVYSPNLAASGSEVNVVWVNNDNPGSFDGWVQYSLRTRRSTDAGTTLEDPVTLHTFPGGYGTGGYPGQETIARIGNRVHVVTVKGDAPAGTFLWTSNDGGTSWDTEKRISTGGWYPHIKLDDTTRVHIVNSWYFRSADAGVTFDGGVNPHDAARSWDYWSLVLGADGAAHYIGCAGGASCAYDGQIMYRRLAPEPAPGATDKVLQMTTTGNARIDNLQIAATPDINFSSAMTIEFWVQRMTDDAYYLENMISKSRLTGSVGSYVISYRSDYGIYSRIVTTQTETAWLGAGVSLPLGTWTHVAMTYDANGGTDNWKIYVDGSLANKATVLGTIVTDTPDSPLRITSSSNGAVYPGQVEIDELRLWNTARTPAEIQAGMYQPLAETESGLTAYYNFNDTFKDITGRGNDAMPMYFEAFVGSSIAPSENTLSVIKSGTGSGTVTSTPSGINCGSTCSGSFDHGTPVTLTATASTGSTFNGWTGCISVSGNTCEVTMTTDKSVSAAFTLNQYTLAVAKSGTGTGTVTGTGINCGSDCTETYYYGTPLTIAATPDAGSRLDGFAGCDTISGNLCTVTMVAPMTITATFTAVSNLTVSKSGTGTGIITSNPTGINCGSDCAETYLKNAAVTLTATPASGSDFAYYAGGCANASPACALTLAADTSVIATFVASATKKVGLTVSKTKTNKGDGTVTSTDGRINCGSDCKDSYYPGSPVILKATPLEGSVFSGWSKECPSPDGDTCTLALDKAITVKAVFIGPYTVKVQKTAKSKGTGTVTSTDGKIACGADCQETYIYNTTITLNAVPDPLSVFSGWSGTGISCPGTGTCSVTVDKAKTVKATFTGPSLLKVTITSKNKGTGTVTSSPPGISCPGDCSEAYPYQAPVTLTADPDPGSTFVSFSGCATTSGSTCTVTMDKAKTVKATFDKPKATAGPDTIEIFGETEGEGESEGEE